ncbi:type II secretion system protein GspL [Pseudidiomarina sp. 1APP75-27a]|uniref:type II secretion system protein GspL n=1 Tax=Pseudidiomarina terrestris TaxID=2820060 RepID=UPI002B05667B|nr:type II secretion system protein GspL [Pseudidiomarina sp. 1APP75-27a]MEA3587728.1 type II secretion system protein GspL [Pseudidiomarina sp. 1APP75-27a]
MEQLYIHLAQPVQWLIWHPGQREVIASGELADAQALSQLREQAQRCEVTLFVPGQEVSLTEVRLPSGSQRLLPQLIPNALEDELASEIESLHFAWPAHAKPAGVEQPIPVTVVQRQRMQDWVSALDAAGIECEAMYPDYFMLPVMEQGCQLKLGQSILVRQGQWQAYSVDYPPVFPIAGENISEQFELPLQVASLGHATGSINLRHGEFRVARKRSKQQFKLPWRAAGIAAAIALVALFAQQLVTYVQLGQENEALNTAINETYLTAFPNESRIVNVRSQLRQHLAEVGSSATTSSAASQSGLNLLAQLDSAFRATPELQVELLRYSNQALTLQVNADDFDTLQRFQEVAGQSGLAVKQGQVTNQDGVVTGNFEVREES